MSAAPSIIHWRNVECRNAVDDFVENWGLWGLFVSALISSTILPGGSEGLLLALAFEGAHNTISLWIAATTGNTLGGMLSWLLGWWLAQRFPAQVLQTAERQRAIGHVRKWGSPVLLLSWLPVVGDPLCVAAGWLKLNPITALLLIAVGKGARYAVLLWFV